MATPELEALFEFKHPDRYEGTADHELRTRTLQCHARLWRAARLSVEGSLYSLTVTS